MANINLDRKNRFQLWLQWIIANAIGELVGLGTVSLIAWFIVVKFHRASIISTVFVSLLMILLGAFEGIAIGLAQWLVLRKIIYRLSKPSWIVASVKGAAIAWTLGILPNTIISLTSQSVSTPPPVISERQIMFLAVLMGIILGLILALPQWIVLRKYVFRANWWLGANSLAWACGMPLVFSIAGSVPETTATLQVIATLLLTITATGGIVGAIHGFVLVWVLRLKHILRAGVL